MLNLSRITNTVEIDDPTTGPSPDVSVVLDEGEVTQLPHINAGTTISSTHPVQVQFIVGKPWAGGASEARGFSALPSPLWDNEYYNPVPGFGNTNSNDGGDSDGQNTDIFIFNANSTAITINYEDKTWSGSFTVPANSTIAYSDPAAANSVVPVDSGVYLSSDDKFWAIGAGDSEDMEFDWGYSLVPAYILSDEYYLGWAPGDMPLPPNDNGSPVFVTPVNDGTVVYVDYSPTDGIVDATYTLDRLDVQRIADSDNDHTGMHIWGSGPLALAWGEDGANADYVDHLDLGYTTLPLPIGWMDAVLGITKTVEPTSLPPGAGQVATFTLAIPVYQLDSGDPFSMTNMVITDTLPSGWAYVNGSTTITLPTGIKTDNPAINGRELVWDLSSDPDLNPNDMVIVVFSAQTTAAVPVGYNENCADVQGVIEANTFVASDCAMVYITPLVVDKDTSTPNVEVGGVATYTIVVRNIDTVALTNVSLADTLPTGFTYADSSVRVSNGSTVIRTATSAPTFGDNTLNWGTWDIGTLEALTITFSVNIAGSVPLGTYDNTAQASSDQTGPVDDAGTARQDIHTPSGEDPEDDEDVTIIPPPPVLNIRKISSAGGGPVSPDDVITYTIVVSNTGNGSATGVTISDTLPAGATYVPESTQVSGWTLASSIETYLDQFSTQAYNNSDGSVLWTSSWDETGDNNSPVNGTIRIATNELGAFHLS